MLSGFETNQERLIYSCYTAPRLLWGNILAQTQEIKMNDVQIPTEELKGKPCPHPHWYIWLELGQNFFRMPLSLLPRLLARPHRPLWHHRWRMTDVAAPVRCSALPRKSQSGREESGRGTAKGKLVQDIEVKKETKEEAITGPSHIQQEWFSTSTTRQTSPLCLRLYCYKLQQSLSRFSVITKNNFWNNL